MNEYLLIIAGAIGSAITLLITAILDYFKEKYRSKMEMKRLVFQRQTDAAERAMSWYQEAVDCFTMMKSACQELEDCYNSVTWNKFIQSSNQANKLYTEANMRLNPSYLYFDFRMVENKHHVSFSMQYINYVIVEIGKDGEKAKELIQSGKDEKCPEMQELRALSICKVHNLSEAFNDQIEALAEMQEELRKKYKKFKI